MPPNKDRMTLNMFVSGALFAIIALVCTDVTCLPVVKRIETVDLNNRCLHIVKEGVKNDKSPVLLLHGLTGSISDWDGFQQVVSLRTGRRVCAVDLRNHGDSPSSEERFDVEVMTEDIANFLDKQNIKKVNVIGHSLGGKTAVHFTLKNPDKIDSLVIEDMRPNGMTEGSLKGVILFARLRQQAIESVPEGLDEQEAKKSIANYLKQKTKELGVPQEIDEKTIQSFQIRLVNNKWQWKFNKNALDVALQHLEKFLTESKGLYEGPTLFIYGTNSAFDVKGDEKNILKLFPNAKLIPVEGAGHYIHRKYEKFQEEVIKLLNGI